MYFLFLNLGGGEIMVIALFVLMFFGSKQIPELMRGLGRATREFKDAMNGIEREVRSAANITTMNEEKTTVPPPPEGTQQIPQVQPPPEVTDDSTPANTN
jgi:sec-independent protein translocase protein TatA